MKGWSFMYMKLKDGKSKVLTLSYDDGVVQDMRLIRIMDTYGLKGTFNINTQMYLPEDAVREQFRGRMKLSEAQALYIDSGHEVAVHSLTHPILVGLKSDEIAVEILEDRKNIEAQYGTLARGMAYPYGSHNQEVVDVLAKCGICYGRTIKSTQTFNLPENWLTWHPTCHHKDLALMELAEKFAQTTPKHVGRNLLFYVWGHSYEFDNNDNWEVIEQFAQYMGNRDDIWYATNIEIYDYVRAYEQLQVSVDRSIVHNPTATTVWFHHNGKTCCVEGGQTLHL